MLQLAALIALAAQAIAVPSPQAASSGTGGKVIEVTVGQNTPPTFSPSNIPDIANGDVILFQFVGAVQHTVTQSTFNDPCAPMPNGFNSGLLGNQSQFALTITDASAPIWFYCQQTIPAKHCGLGMVGSINAPTDPNLNTFDKFLATAKAIGDSEGPQSPTPVLSAAVAIGTVASSGTSGKTITVIVGQNAPTFSPPNISGIANGDIILFQFVGAVQHTVTQSAFNDPCTPIPNGFNSGLLGNDSQFALTITDASTPIWFYCQQTIPAKHCGLGMVGSINAPTDPDQNTFGKFLAAAKAIGDSEGPQLPTPVLSAVVATGTIQPALSASGTVTTSAISPPPSPTNPSNGGDSSNGSGNGANGSGNGTGGSGNGTNGSANDTNGSGNSINGNGNSTNGSGNSTNGGGDGSNNAAGMVTLSMTGLTVGLSVVVAALGL